VVAAAVVVAGPVPGRAGAEVTPGDGTATHYDSVDGGNCSFPAAPADHLDVALSEIEYGTADACGAYLDVTGPRGTVRVVVTNRCPECQPGHLDLSRQAFARIGDPAAGQIDVTYSLVRDPPLAETIGIRVKDGSSRWWLQLQALDHGNPLASVELATAGGWRSLVHTQDNFWMAENPGPGDGPLTVRITDIHGQSATIDGIAIAPGEVQRSDARLYGPGEGADAGRDGGPAPRAGRAGGAAGGIPPLPPTAPAAASPPSSRSVRRGEIEPTHPGRSADP
ncbi:MAG TPA: expansin EXLX1 family cellulose-binding protein, partial [Acidimicrobiales bacterium]|nr:expansin EXLX1 family cellulose-binding protein [Acidimicrobiales bacterium]